VWAGSGLSQINFVSADQIRPLDPVNLLDGGCSLKAKECDHQPSNYQSLISYCYYIFLRRHTIFWQANLFSSMSITAHICFASTSSPLLFIIIQSKKPAELKLWLFHSTAYLLYYANIGRDPLCIPANQIWLARVEIPLLNSVTTRWLAAFVLLTWTSTSILLLRFPRNRRHVCTLVECQWKMLLARHVQRV
jgi:hypothetical protein